MDYQQWETFKARGNVELERDNGPNSAMMDE